MGHCLLSYANMLRWDGWSSSWYVPNLCRFVSRSNVSTAHRVIVPDASVAASHRYSIACFIDPDAGHLVAVDERFVQPGEMPKYAPITGLDYLLSKLNEAQGK